MIRIQKKKFGFLLLLSKTEIYSSMKLKIELAELEKKINELVSEYEAIEEGNFETETKLEKGKTYFIELTRTAEAFLETIVPKNENYYYSTFHEPEINFKKPEATPRSFKLRCNELVQKSKKKKKDLQRIYKAISISDIRLNKISDEELLARKNFSVREKKMLILEKLFKINDGWYYSVKSIYAGNNLHPARPDELMNIANSLEKDNLIEIFRKGIREPSVRLTLHGEEVVEDIIAKRIKLAQAVSTVKQDLDHDLEDVNLTNVKANLKELIAENEFENVFEKLDLMITEESVLRNDLIMMMGRFQSVESKRRNGILTDSEYLVHENKIRFDLISIIESLSFKEIRK